MNADTQELLQVITGDVGGRAPYGYERQTAENLRDWRADLVGPITDPEEIGKIASDAKRAFARFYPSADWGVIAKKIAGWYQ